MSNDTHMSENFYRAKAYDFSKIPGSPIAYWVSDTVSYAFEHYKPLGWFLDIKAGMSTTDNQLFLRQWFEINRTDLQLHFSKENQNCKTEKRWFPYIKGGSFRRWYGNNDYVVNWKNSGEDIKQYIAERPEKQVGGRLVNMEFFFKECLAWTRISSGSFSARYYPEGSIFSDASNGGFGKRIYIESILLLLNSKIVTSILKVISPTLNFYAGDIAKLPAEINKTNMGLFKELIKISCTDWDSSETSWDFTTLPMISSKTNSKLLSEKYSFCRQRWIKSTNEMQSLEEENNQIIIETYGLQDELSPEVPLNEITLTCNPHFRYGKNKSAHELENLLLGDTMKELISYAVGCMFGRYSLDKDGLILANIDEGINEYLEQISEPSFIPDKSGILPITDENDFTNDITNQFKVFLKASFCAEKFSENLRFIEEAIGKDIRSFVLKDFYKDHIKRYKKRPIYWMISSPSGAFRALIYLHRYTIDTISLFLNDYLRPYQRKLEAKVQQADQVLISASLSNSDKTRAQKNLDKIRKVLNELEGWERDVVYPLATQRIELDLDDGVKVNYGKLGSILEKVKGLNA